VVGGGGGMTGRKGIERMWKSLGGTSTSIFLPFLFLLFPAVSRTCMTDSFHSSAQLLSLRVTSIQSISCGGAGLSEERG
jgi:hypothetical protein